MDLRELVESYKLSCIVMTAVELELFPRMKTPATLDEVSLGLHGPSVERLLSALVSMTLVVKKGEIYSLTELGRAFCEEGSMHLLAQINLHQYFPLWSQLAHSIRTGAAAAEKVLGEGAWSRRATGGKEGQQFIAFMERIQERSAPLLVSAYDFSGFARVVDVGGGAGHVIRAILERWPDIKGTVFDLPHVIPTAEATLAHLKNRCECIGGSFFEFVPPGDLYILRYILHDWDDENCLRILRNIRQAATPGAKLLIVENHTKNPLKDLHMLVISAGRERTAEELHGLITQANCRSVQRIDKKLSEVIL